MSYATVKDVSDRLGRPIVDAEEVQQVNSWIRDATAIILSRIPDLAERVNAGDLDPDVVTMVVANAVERKVKNPDGKQNERIDDYSYGLSEDSAKGSIFITDSEWELLHGTTTDGAFSIIPSGVVGRDYWWPTTDRAEWL